METNGKGPNIRYGPDMKILIIGGGVAGLTLAGLLERRGFTPRLVERAPAFGKVGYVIVIWPSGSRVLKGLGAYEKLLEEGCQFTNYYISNYQGEVIKTYSIDPVAEKYGPIISIYRPELIDTLIVVRCLCAGRHPKSICPIGMAFNWRLMVMTSIPRSIN